ncbi:hypothetical protein ACE6H2_016316 [Prunus campanulata]
MAEVAIRVLCAGMLVTMSSLTEFSIAYADGYVELANQWDNAKARDALRQADEYDIMPFQPSRTSSVKIHPPDGMGSSLTIVLPFQDSQYHPRTSIE